MIGLLELEPDFEAALPAEERGVARRVGIPVHTVAGKADADVGALLEQRRAFGAVVLDGLLLHRLSLRGQMGVRVLGPGDLVMPGRDPHLMCMAESDLTAQAGARLAFLEETFATAIRRWPALMLHLLDRLTGTAQMLEAQLVICQLPRVEDRLSAVLWLLAERWGRVTPTGTYLPVRLTHETLGALIGAARPTITLALAELVDGGAVLRQSDGWLLTEPPPRLEPTNGTRVETPSLLSPPPSPWQKQAPPMSKPRPAALALSETIRGASEQERNLSILHRETARALREHSRRLRTRADS